MLTTNLGIYTIMTIRAGRAMTQLVQNSRMNMAEKVVLIYNAGIVTMDEDSRVFLKGALVVQGTQILAVGQSTTILEEFSSQADELLDMEGNWILPGLINTHVHTSQQLARGIADDVDLLTWLHHRIWPYESSMTEEDSYISTLLCGVELIHSGVTCFAEAGGQHVAGMAHAVEKLGIRACLSRSTMDAGEGLPAVWAAETAETCIEVQEELFEKFNGKANDRIHIWFGLRQIMNSTNSLLVGTKESASRCNTGIHMHVAEIPFENDWVSKTQGVEHGTVTFLKQIGLLDKNLLAAHSVWVNGSEVGMMAQAGVKVSHCPAAAMRMLGFAPITEMLSAGICVSLGTDGAPSNNRMSLVDEMYVASLINKGKVVFDQGTTNPEALPAQTVLKMATINGARAVLWDNLIGSLEPGKKADLVIVDPNKWTMLPLHDPISSIVYCMRTENIMSVMCDGQWIMRDQKILTVDEGEVVAKARIVAKDLILRAGIQLPKPANVL